MVRDYESDVIKQVQEKSRPKTVIARAVKGNYPDALKVIESLCKKNFLEIKEGKLTFKANNIIQDHTTFQEELQEFREAFYKFQLPELKKIRKQTREPIFYVTKEPNGAQMFRVNQQAKEQIISTIMHLIDRTIRSSFSLYQKQLLGLVPKPYVKIIDDDIRSCLTLIKEIKEKLSNMISKKNKPSFESYWFQVTSGLRVNF
ncbi:MAG: hypothetical protein GKS07_06740 [Nitrosopumilus sp.]|nr:MAG: hypothetical protein GKS07_06740 [Nitrosopumilus sp.]